MNGVDVLRSAFRASHFWFDGTVADVTPELERFSPPGKAHGIPELAAHIVQAEDWVVHGLAQGKPTVWESGAWEARLGMPGVFQLPEAGSGDFPGSVAELRPYAEAVYRATDQYFDELSDADLDREIDMSAFGMEPTRLGDVLTMLALGNNFAHTGEISAIKGIQGAKGYPF